jgi:hypothetical protein
MIAEVSGLVGLAGPRVSSTQWRAASSTAVNASGELTVRYPRTVQQAASLAASSALISGATTAIDTSSIVTDPDTLALGDIYIWRWAGVLSQTGVACSIASGLVRNAAIAQGLHVTTEPTSGTRTWHLLGEMRMHVVLTGASGLILVTGWTHMATANGRQQLGSLASDGVSVGLNTTVANTFLLRQQLTGVVAGNSLQIHQSYIRGMRI